MGTPLHALTDKAVSISSTSYKDFVKHSDESIQHVVRKLNDAHERMNLPADDADYLSSEAFGELEKVLGWNYNPSNIILNRRFNLKIASMMMFDAAHVYVHDGLADTELGQMMKVFFSNKCKTSFKELGEYVSTFTFPKMLLRSSTCSLQVLTKTIQRMAVSPAQDQSFSLWRLC